MDARTAASHRLHNQQIAQPTLTSPVEVVRHLGAIQGQDYLGAKWSIGLRLPGSTDAAIEQAIALHAIVRTWLLRGTLHFAAADDVRWMLALVAPRLIAGNARRYHQLELDEPTLARSNALLAGALQGGRELDRRALLALLEERGISTEGQRGVYLLQRASLDGLIAQGVQRGRYGSFFALDTLPPAKSFSHEESLAELARRYFISRGPATLRDFVWWSSLTTPDARAAIASIQGELDEDTIGDQVCWRAGVSPTIDEVPAALLPGFDEYLLAYQDRGVALDPAHAQLIQRGGMFAPAIMIEGRVVGTWQRAVKKRSATITLQPFAPLSDSQLQAISDAAQRYGAFLGLPVEVH